MTVLPLPASSGTFEKALAAAMDDGLAFDYAVIMDPYRTPEGFLPFLAAHHSVDLWFDDWPENRKREMVAQCAGRSTVYPDSPELGALKGTFEGLKRYLEFVDATVIDRISYPARFVFGRSVIGRTPINHPPFQARYLIKVILKRQPNSFVAGRSALGRTGVRPVDLEPIRRAKKAVIAAKFEHVEYLITFAYRRRAAFGDALPFDGSQTLNPWLDRERL